MIIYMAESEREKKSNGRWGYWKYFPEYELSEEQYERITGNEARRFFKNLGGKEIIKSYYTTSTGRKISCLLSVSPSGNREIKRTFRFV